MLAKLKYVGTKTEDLLTIYCMYIRSILEYCSTVWHSSLTEQQTEQLEADQSAALYTILGENYVSASAAREMTGMELLSVRRERRIESFCLKALKHPRHSQLFPRNKVESETCQKQCCQI